MIIDLPRFLASGRPAWSELETMLDKMERDPDHRFDFDQVRHFYHLYQRTSADLAKIQTFASEPEICRYLESLTSRAYAEINETRERSGFVRPWFWFVEEFPAAFRRHVRAFHLSLLITLIGALFGAIATGADPEAKSAIIPEQFSHLMGSPSQRVHKEEARGHSAVDGRQAEFATYLMQHNIRVSIAVLALGMTWALGTIILLFYNGVILGSVVLDYIRDHQTAFVFGWILPHGVIELPAVMIAGQAGLLIGKALLGGRERNSLKARFRALGPDLMSLIGGASVMLLWAGLIESFFSQVHEPVMPYSAKIAFGIAELLVLIWFLNRRGSAKQDAPAKTDVAAP